MTVIFRDCDSHTCPFPNFSQIHWDDHLWERRSLSAGAGTGGESHWKESPGVTRTHYMKRMLKKWCMIWQKWHSNTFNLYVKCHPRYWIANIIVNPAKFGAPIDRRRLYMVMIRHDVLSDETLEILDDAEPIERFTRLIAERVCGLNMPCKYDWNLVLYAYMLTFLLHVT